MMHKLNIYLSCDSPTFWLICIIHIYASSCEISLCKRKKKIGFSRIYEFIKVHWFVDAVEKSWLILRDACILYHMSCCLLACVWNNHYYNFLGVGFKNITEILTSSCFSKPTNKNCNYQSNVQKIIMRMIFQKISNYFFLGF